MAEKRTRLSDMTKAGRKAEKPTVIGAIRDPQFVRDVLQGLGETATRGITGVLGAPVDITTMAMRPFGYSVPAEQVVGGSEYLGKQLERAGMLSGNRNQLSELLAGLVTPDPVDAAKLGAMFIGPLAKTWDAEAAAKAARMELEGADPRAIWAETGTWKGPEGKWRQEIDDSAAANRFSPPEVRELWKLNEGEMISPQQFAMKYPESEAAQQIRLRNSLYQGKLNDDTPFLGDALKHEQLFAAYPEFGYGVKTTISQKMPIGEAGYSEPKKLIMLSPMQGKQADEVMLHEIQHAIQEKEKFARGGTPEEFSVESMQQAVNSQRLLDNISKTGAEDFGRFYEKGNFSDLQSAAEEYAKKKNISVDDAYSAAESFWTFGGEKGGLSGLQNRIKQAQTAIDDAFTLPFEKYRRLAGEAEARATQARMGMTAEERRAKFPEESYDIPIRDLIIR